MRNRLALWTLSGTIFLFTILAAAPTALAQSQTCRRQAVADDAAYNATPYNELFQVACHNCYDKGTVSSYAKTFYEVLNKTNFVEIDFWDYKNSDGGAQPHHWFVRHEKTAGKSGNDNNCTGDGQGTNDLRACLGDVARWSNDHPGHNLITVNLDKKQDWGTDRQPPDLDQLITEVIPADKIYMPSQLKHTYSSLRVAAANQGWPTLSTMKGKILFMLSGGREDHHNQTQHKYLESRGNAAVIFVAPDTDEISDVTSNPNEFNDTTAMNVVFYNIKYGKGDLASMTSAIHSRHYLSRVWNGDQVAACSFADVCASFPAYKDFTVTCDNQPWWRLPAPNTSK